MTPRIVLAVAGSSALVLPLPALTILGVGLTAAGLLALLYGLSRPGSHGPVVLIAAAATSWLVTPDDHQHLLRLGALALAVTLVHTSAALAAVIPTRAGVPAPVALRWGGWSAAATAVGCSAVAGAAVLPSGGAGILLTVTAVLAAAAAGSVVAWRTSRNPTVY
ncbi:MAG: hypothetical protein JHC71_11310 [Blastococcus sp.]|nr:hypothetical protein [Blastococcus sp.]